MFKLSANEIVPLSPDFGEEKLSAYTVPLALISPEAVMFPVTDNGPVNS